MGATDVKLHCTREQHYWRRITCECGEHEWNRVALDQLKAENAALQEKLSREVKYRPSLEWALLVEDKEIEIATLRERIAELEAELWNCKQSLTPPQRPEDATYYLETT